MVVKSVFYVRPLCMRMHIQYAYMYASPPSDSVDRRDRGPSAVAFDT